MFIIRALRPLAFAAFAVAAVAAVPATPSAVPTSLRHTRLVKSVPARNDTLATAPKTLDLWFSEDVDLAILSVKVAGRNGAAVALGKPAWAGADKDRHVSYAVVGAMAAGGYTVTWSVAGEDGHPTKGSFDFVVKPGK
jgi:methionine-rich copper-binding protein CopC